MPILEHITQSECTAASCLLEKFRENAGKNLDNDRILLSKVEK